MTRIASVLIFWKITRISFLAICQYLLPCNLPRDDFSPTLLFRVLRRNKGREGMVILLIYIID